MRALRFLLMSVVVWGLQTGVSFAEANWWDHLSGPGGFVGGFIDYRFACFAKEGKETLVVGLSPTDRTALPTLWRRASPPAAVPPLQGTPTTAELKQKAATDCRREENVRGYLVATIRYNYAYHNGLVPSDSDPLCAEGPARDNCNKLRRVYVFTHEIGYMARLGYGTAVGASVGLNGFWGPAFNSFHRGTVIPKFEFDPRALHHDGPGAHWIKIIVGGTIFWDGFSSSDFCNKTTLSCAPIKSWSSGAEIRPEIGIVFDVGERSR